MTPYRAPFAPGDAARQAITAAIPVLTTKRLILRAPQITDWNVLEPIWRTDRGQYIGGPFGEEDAWLDFNQAVAGWVLRGIGYWTVTERNTGAVLGFVGVGCEYEDPELEFGWLLTADAEGQGYAFEACTAVRAYAFDTLGLRTLISFVDKRNTRSIHLAQRLGAVHDPAAVPPAFIDDDFAFRHSPQVPQ
ncbi:MAG: GNAT family N-acetyltransferase [Pseudomonadota bacterium]